MYKNKKIIYIFERKYGYPTDRRIFGLDYYIKKGFSLEVWSLADWTFCHNPNERPKNIDLSGLTIYISNEKEFEANMERIKNENCFFILYPYHAYNTISLAIRKSIKKHNFEFINLTESECNYEYTSDNKIIIFFYYLIKSICSSLKTISFIFKGFKTFKNRYLEFKAKKIGPDKYKSYANIITTVSSLYYLPSYGEAVSDKNIFVHHETYDDWMLAKDATTTGDFIVYIDQGLTVNDDYKRNYGISIISDDKLFFKDLIFLFDIISKDYNCDIVVATHPKAMYKGGEFGKYKMISGQTNSLIKNAKMIIIETSTCLGQVILNKKPFLNIYRKEYFNTNKYVKRYLNNIKKCLNCEQLDFSDRIQVLNYKQYVKNYVESDYDRFKNAFIVSKYGIINKITPEIIADIILNCK